MSTFSEQIHDDEIVISWHGLPEFAAACIRRAIERSGVRVNVVATRAAVPVDGVEQTLGQEVYWVDEHASASWTDLGIPVPRYYFQTGWSVRAFNALSRQVRRSGGKVADFVDNIPRHDLRQFIGNIAYRLWISRRYSAVLVPGVLGTELMRSFGVPRSRIFTGLLGADPDTFRLPDRSDGRLKEFLFVGQYIHRKGLDILLQSFAKVHGRHPEVTLRLVGSGPLRDRLSGEGVIREDFLPARELAERFRRAAYFVLPSREEHWGVVVHEAALSGNVLLLSDRTGAAPDLLDTSNGFLFAAESVESLEAVMEQCLAISTEKCAEMSRASRRKAERLGPNRWAETFVDMVNLFQSADQTHGVG